MTQRPAAGSPSSAASAASSGSSAAAAPRTAAADGSAAGRSVRDAQRGAVYAAEDQVARLLDRSAEFPLVEIAGSRLTLPIERHFGDLDSVRRYVRAVLTLAWVRARWPEACARPVAVRERRGARRAHYERETEDTPATIAVPLHASGGGWALRELVLLHEIAHHLGSRDEPAHGPTFAGRLCDLVDGVVGPEAALLLRVTLADQGAVVGPDG